MDKNKNRTDLLAAGRKKLQQYRKNKDGKGGKSSGKANKHDRDVVTDESSSSVVKSSRGIKPLSDTEVSEQGSSIELVDSSSQSPTDNLVATNMDVATPDRSSTSSLPIEVSKDDEPVDALVLGEESSNLDDVMATVSPPRTVDIEGKHESGFVTPLGLKAVLDDGFDREAGEMIAAPGEDQVPDEDDRSYLDPDNRTSLIDVEGDVIEDTRMESTSSAIEQTSEQHDAISSFASAIDDSGATNADVHSDSGFPSADHKLIIDDSAATNENSKSASGLSSDLELTVDDSGATKLPSSDHKPTIDDSGATDANSHSDSGLPSADHQVAIDDSGATNTDSHSASGLLSSDHKTTIDVSDVTDADSRSASGLPSSNHQSTIDGSDVTDANSHSASGLPSSDHEPAVGDSGATSADSQPPSGLPSSDHKPTIDDSVDTNADVVAVFHGDERIKLPPISDDSEVASLVSGVISGSEVTPVSLTHLAKVIQLLGEDDFRFLVAARESGSLQGSKNDGDKNLGSAEFSEKLKEQLYINNFEKELVYLQLCEESDVRKKFDQHHLRCVDEKSSFTSSLDDLKSKNRVLSEELASCRSELDMVTNKMEELQMNVSFSKTELDWSSTRIQDLEVELSKVSSELAESRNLISDSQAKNETLNVNLASLTKEKGGVVLENEKLIKELMECKSLLESSQVENVNYKESLALVTEERMKMEEIKQKYVSEKENLLKDLVEWKKSVESLVAENAKLDGVLASEREERKKLEERNNKLDGVLASEREERSKLEERNNKLDGVLATEREERNKLEERNNKLDGVLASEREERSKVEERNNKLGGVLASEREERSKLEEKNNKVSIELSESNHLVENLRSELANLRENLDLATQERTKIEEQMNNLRFEKDECLAELTSCKSVLKDLQETGGKLEEPTEAMKEQSNSLEETFLKNVILDEFMKQYVHTKKGEFMVLCEDLKQEGIISKTKNSELNEKLTESESRIHELQIKLEDLKQEGIISKTKNSVLKEKLTESESRIHELQEKLEDAIRAHNLLSDSYKDVNEKIKDLEGANELAAYVIHKVFDNLQKIVNNSGPSTKSEDDTRSGQLDHLEISNYDVFIERLIMILRERAQLEFKNREYNLGLLRRIKDLEEVNKKFISPDVIVKLLIEMRSMVNLDDIEIKPSDPLSALDSMFHSLIKKLELKSTDFQSQLTFSIVPYEIENQIFKESLRSAIEHVHVIQSKLKMKETELHQSETRVSALREKLHIAVTKGKGLIQQRDTLKQNLTATSNELEKRLHELQLKDDTLQETETKLKTYSEAGERMEALESELSYIRNSATALRESFLLKDSVLQRIEEILEDLDLPEHFHVRDIIEKIDWLAKSVSQKPSQTGSLERAYSYPGSGAPDGWRENLEPVVSDELRRNYEELQNRFYGLAEQNEMLEQSLMERNNLVQRCEEILEKTNMPLQLRSLDPEDRIDWLCVALLEANERCEYLQQDLEKVGSLSADLEESHSRLIDLETALKSIIDERDQISSRLEAQSHDFNQIVEKVGLYEIENDKLQNEVDALKSKLDEKIVDEEHIHHEIRRLQDLVKNMLQDPETEDLDSSKNDIECLEGLLKKLEEKYPKHPSDFVTERSIELERKLEEAEGERDKHVEKIQSLVHEIEALESKNQELQKLIVQEAEVERDKHVEKIQSLVHEIEALELKNQESQKLIVQEAEGERAKHVEKIQSLVHEIEALELKNQELQKLIVQEEQKCAVVREKLNVAVRKGKSLVQQRDAMKQTINELTSEVDRLNAEIKVRENTLLAHQEKIKDLFTAQELLEHKDSEIQFLKNHLSEAENELQDKQNSFSMILGRLEEIDLGVELRTDNPIEKLEQIEKVCRDLHVAMSSAEQDSRKSKRAAELLLAELNEVQERNEDLLEEISKLSMGKDSAETAMRDSLSHLEQLSALHLEERSSQVSELMMLKSGLEQLKPKLSKIFDLLNDVLPKDLDHLYNLEAIVKSLLESSDGISSKSKSKDNLHSRLFLDSKRDEEHSDNEILDLWRFVGTHVQDLATNINVLEQKLQSHSKSLHKEAIVLSETVSTLKHSLESTKEEIVWLDSIGKQKETENLALRKHISILYEACKNSVLEIKKNKASNDEDMTHELNQEGETILESEERIMGMVNRLLSCVKEFNSFQADNMEVNLKEMKDRIANLQKELTEKDVQKDRICVDLVSQIKRAEAASMNNLQELESAKSQINDLKRQLEDSVVQCNTLEQRVKDLEGQESILVDLQEKVKSLTHALTSKEQEAEALLQALDEEEAQMEDLTNKNTELERLIKQKDLDLENTEAARGKVLKKLSITVSKFNELHRLSETLVSEVDNLQSQLQERDSEVSFLRNEITRCTSDSLQALESDKRGINEIQDILTWLDSMGHGVETQDSNLDENKTDQVHEFKETLKKQITSIVSELKELRQVAQSKDDELHIERSKVEDLMNRRVILENSLKEQESRLSLHQGDGDSARASMTSEIVEVEPLINKWPKKGTSMASQVRSLRKVNNDQLAISIDDMDSDEKDKLEDEDDDKAHGFKSLTTSKLVPKFTRPVTNFIDGLWVTCDRALMRQPLLRLSLILYWALMHALLAVFVV